MHPSTCIRVLCKTAMWNTKVRHLQIPRIQKPLGIRLMTTKTTYQHRNEQESFLDALPGVMDTLTNNSQFTQIPEVASWLKKVLDYSLAGGKRNRGVTTVLAYEALEKPDKITEESMKQARILGWCTELLQTYFLTLDDIMDGSTTRRGVTCWYRLPEVGIGAINDAILIQMSAYQLLKVHFGHLPQYMNLVDLFNETILFTSAGQHLDFATAVKKKDYSLYTIERYNSIITYKTGYYSYRTPIKLAMLLANITDESTSKKADEISLELGVLFQTQDDFIDCFSDESTSGKAGTDIQEGKCCWLAVMALELANPTQKDMFKQYYGSKKPEHIKKIKDLYVELKLPQIYREKERALYEDIMRKAEIFSKETGCSSEIFTQTLNMIYNRKR